jgi:hypothetical protein
VVRVQPKARLLRDLLLVVLLIVGTLLVRNVVLPALGVPV